MPMNAEIDRYILYVTRSELKNSFVNQYIWAQKITWLLPLRPHVCTLYQIMYALSGHCLILGHCTLYKAGVCCLYRGDDHYTDTDCRLRIQFFYKVLSN